MCGDPTGAYHAARPQLRLDSTLLLKASRTKALERWLPLLQRDFATDG